MFFKIDLSNDLAIYDQVVRQVKFAVAGAVLRVGELVPSVRELARELCINPNTVARAYRELQADGVLEPVRGTGLAVAEGADKRCRTERVKLIRQRLKQVLVCVLVTQVQDFADPDLDNQLSTLIAGE